MQILKNPLLKTFLPINVAHSLNIKRKWRVDATKNLSNMWKALFWEKLISSWRIGSYTIFLQLTRNCISKQNVSSTKTYLTPNYGYTHTVETS